VGDPSEFSFAVRAFLAAYRWRRIDPVPLTPLVKPLSECRLALISSAGLTLREQTPFDKSAKGGDVSFRQISSEASVANLVESHRSESFDHSGLEQDPNLAFPLDGARSLVSDGRIGSLAAMHLSMMGSITAPGRLIAHTAPEMAATLVADAVDIALLVPV